jgi:hypothetical protein
MTEAEWLKESGNSQWMLAHLEERRAQRTKVGRRKLRLYACGCCRAVWDLLPDDRLRATVEVAERLADGQASPEEMAAARDGVSWMRDDSAVPRGTPAAVRVAIDMAVSAAYAQPFAAAFAVTAMSPPLASRRGNRRAGEAHLCDLLRCVFGNPFRPVSSGPWITPAAVTVARDCYDRRDFAALPLLADLLEEAGCPEQSMLDHCRKNGEHLRGCWVVDLVLSKA